MSKKRGLSLDEKRTKMQELFYERKEFFQMKELEKLGPREKGVISQSVKEVVQSLVDDNLVDTEKIGTFVCYWSFPSKAINAKRRQLAELTTKTEAAKTRCAEINARLPELKALNEDTEERRTLQARLHELEGLTAKQDAELRKYSAFDPDTLAEHKTQTEGAIVAANRWTDNIFSARQWMKKKFGLDEKMINKNFEIPDELDYIVEQ